MPRRIKLFASLFFLPLILAALPLGAETLKERLLGLGESERQRQLRQLQNGQYDELTEQTGDSAWSATGLFRRGEFAEAATQFGLQERTPDLYNAATAMAHAGDYDQSLATFDELLATHPQHQDALHNRAIVEQLKKLQEQQQQQQQQGDGEGQEQNEDQQDPTENSDGQQQADQNNQSGEQQSPEQQQQSGQQQNETKNAESQPIDESQLQQTEQEKQALQQAIEQAAEELQREEMMREPMTESEQATEQWLRQIPDDPAGLLRRKLQRSHASDYPSIGDSKEPW